MNHTFDIKVAEEFGVDQAIMISNFQFWIALNIANRVNFRNGKYWTYNTYKAIATLHPYWSEKQCRRILNDLLQKEVLIDGNFNEKPYDLTKWYTFADDKWIDESLAKALAQTGRGLAAPAQTGKGAPAQTGKGAPAQTGKPIPDTNKETDIKRMMDSLSEPKSSDSPEKNEGEFLPDSEPPKNVNTEVLEGVKLPASLYPTMSKSYFDWYKLICNGNEPKCNKGDWAALKEMVWYFYKGVISRGKGRDEVYEHEEICRRANNAFLFVLKGLEAESRIEAFLKSGKKLAQINSNLTNIIDQIKNGNPKDRQQRTAKGATTDTLRNKLAEELGLTPGSGE